MISHSPSAAILSARKLAIAEAVSKIRDGMTVGLGTGTTTELIYPLLRELIAAGWRLYGVPTSVRTEELARSAGIQVRGLAEVDHVDLSIDGADEVAPDLNLIKGRGGALLREKVVAQLSSLRIIVVDEEKPVPILGARFDLPVESVPFAWPAVERALLGLGATTSDLRRKDGEPFVTDNGNYVIDAKFERIVDPVRLDQRIHQIAGVVEHGLFIGLTDIVLVGELSGRVRVIKAEGTRE